MNIVSDHDGLVGSVPESHVQHGTALGEVDLLSWGKERLSQPKIVTSKGGTELVSW